MDWKRFFDSIGMNGTWWQWRIYRWQEAWRARNDPQAKPVQSAAARYVFCRKCGAMMLAGESACSRCGATAPSRASAWFQRTLGLVMPQWHPVSSLLLFANVANLLTAMFVFGASQLLNPTGIMLVKMGALDPTMFLAGDFWRIITYGYLHIGIMHIGFNLLALSQVGPVLEEQVGSPRLFSIYTLSLISGGALDVILRGNQSILVAGASGALFGLIGFGMSFAHFYGGSAGRAQRDFFLRWAIYGFAFGYLIGADNICHLGGFIMGAALGFLIERERGQADRFNAVWKAIAWLLALVTVGAFILMLLASSS